VYCTLTADCTFADKDVMKLCLRIRQSLKGISHVREPAVTKISEIDTVKL
jgi:hypothetical protein